MKLILGSASPWRKELLSQLGEPFIVMHPNIDEEAIVHDDPSKLVELIALAKAEALLPKIKELSILITCDQVVVCNGEIRGKPKTPDDVRRYLQSYGDYPAETYTSVVLTHSETKKQKHFVDHAKVYFKSIPESVIQAAIEEGNVFSCAGGFQIEGDALFSNYIKSIEGDLDSIKGLPLKITEKFLGELYPY